MRSRIFALALVACLPAAGLAQKKASGDDAAPSSGGGGGGGGMKSPSSRDLSDMNPASMLMDKKKKLSLADSTVAALKAVQKKLNDRNAAFYSGYDSTRKWTVSLSSSSSSQAAAGLHGGATDSKLTSVGASPAEMAKMQSSMRDLRAMMSDFRERRKADVADALAVVPEALKKAAADMLNGQDADVEKLLSGK